MGYRKEVARFRGTDRGAPASPLGSLAPYLILNRFLAGLSSVPASLIARA